MTTQPIRHSNNLSNVNPTVACCAEFYALPIVSLLLGESFHPGGIGLTRKMAEAAFIGRNTRVLDVACGRGTSARVVTADFGATVTGIDYAVSNLKHAQSASSAAGDPRFVAGLSLALPLTKDSFDVVTCECALCTFDNKTAALEEIHRVLKPGGRLALSDLVVNKPIPESLVGVFARAICVAGALPQAEYEVLLAENGFINTRTTDQSSALIQMINTIEKRLAVIQRVGGTTNAELGKGFENSTQTLVAAREFVRTGGLGYRVFVSRKTR